jgi:lipoprotein-anchoring transpeptidase ErfK/SrfK
MARHPLGARAGQKARNRTYSIIAIVLVIGVAIAFYYGPFGKNEAEPIDDPNISSGPETLTATDSNAMTEDTNRTPTGIALTSNTETDVSEVNDVVASVPPTEARPQPNPTEPNLSAIGAGKPPSIRNVNPEQPDNTNIDGTNVPTILSQQEVQPGDEAAVLIAEADKLIRTGDNGIIAVREKLNEAMRMPMSPAQRSSVKDRLSKLSEQWLFSKTILPNDPLCESYLVKRGERLEVIASRYKVPWEILLQINKISRPEALRAESTIKVINGPFRAIVYRSTFTMDLYLQNTYVRSFKVGLGKSGMETPTGIWRVKPGGKLERPIWTNPIDQKTYHPEDPDYPLGSRWIALEGLSGEAKDRTGFAIHGTKEPEQIGAAGSQGCIRMHNGEAILVYNLLVPTYSQVEVTD